MHRAYGIAWYACMPHREKENLLLFSYRVCTCYAEDREGRNRHTHTRLPTHYRSIPSSIDVCRKRVGIWAEGTGEAAYATGMLQCWRRQ